MSGEDMAAFADSIFESVRAYCQKEVSLRVGEAVSDLQRLIDTLPAARDGSPGVDGKDGVDGQNGRDADPEAITAGLMVELSKMVEALPKATHGRDGQAGRDGADGRDADPEAIRIEVQKAVSLLPKPKDGESVDVEVLRAMVKNEVADITKGIVSGRDGRDGRDGDPGRDAFEIDVLPAIDFSRRYQRGTWASHKNGLWLARTATEGERGWECVSPGLERIEIEEATDGRTRVERHFLSDGRTFEFERKSREMIYRKVFREGQSYEPGDTVTWGGSMWHCDHATLDKPGEASQCWTLAAKRGRDGKQ